MEEHALIVARKALHHHNTDLELLFKSKQDAEVSGDTVFVKYAFDQINAIAKTIADGAEACHNLEQQVESSKVNLERAQNEVLPSLRSSLSSAMCTL